MAKRSKAPPSLPSKEDVIAFVRESPRPVGRREIARAFRIKGSELRVQFKSLLRELEDEGVLEPCEPVSQTGASRGLHPESQGR